MSNVKNTRFSVDKCPASYDTYEFTLPELYRKLAHDELREDDEIREQSLAQMRDWIAKHPHIRKCRTDAKFLLRFLRFRKFSVPTACEALESYLAMREKHPDFFKNLDCNDPAIREMLADGVFAYLGTDEQGRSVIYCRFARFNVEKFTALQEIRFSTLLVETLLEGEERQIGGYRLLVDYSDTVLKHYGIWGLSDMKIFMEAVNRTYPIRIREVHSAKFPKIGLPVVNVLLSFASTKLRDRITCHTTVAEMAKQFDVALLTTECGGKRVLGDLTKSFLQLLEEQREVVLGLDEMDIDTAHYTSIWSQINTQNGEIDSGVTGSFRKLTVD